MDRIQQIIARCKAIDTAQADIERRAELENEGRFTDEMRSEYATLKTEFDTLIAEKKQLESDAEMRAARAGRAADLEPKALPRKVDPTSSSPAPQKPVDANPAEPNTKPRFTVPATAKRYGAGTLRSFTGVVDNMAADERAYRFGMWAMSRIQQCLPGYHIPGAREFVNNYMGGIYNTAHGETDQVTGGQFLVPEEFSSDLIVLREKYGVARRLLKREVMISDIKHVPKRLTGLTAYFVGENQAGTESNMTWQDIQLVAKDLTILTRMSNQLSADAAIAVGDELAGEIAYACAYTEDNCAFNGDGSSTYGGIQGIRNMLINADGANTKSASTVTAGVTGAWTSLVLSDFNKVVGLLPAYADSDSVTWVCHKTFYGQVMQKLEAAAGGNTIATLAMGDRGPQYKFLGYPVTFAQTMPAATASTGVPVIFGDLSLGASFGDRQQTSIAFSEHATINGESVFERNQIAIRGTERFDINVHGCRSTTVVGPIVGLALA